MTLLSEISAPVSGWITKHASPRCRSSNWIGSSKLCMLLGSGPSGRTIILDVSGTSDKSRRQPRLLSALSNSSSKASRDAGELFLNTAGPSGVAACWQAALPMLAKNQTCKTRRRIIPVSKLARFLLQGAPVFQAADCSANLTAQGSRQRSSLRSKCLDKFHFE